MIKRFLSSLPSIEKKYFQRTVILLTLLFCAITCAIFAWYSYLGYSIVPTYKKHLWSMATKRADEIDVFLTEQENNAVKLSEKSTIITTLNDAYTKKEPTISTEKLNDFLAPYKEQMFFKNILLIDTEGSILFSTKNSDIIGKNINKNSYAHSALSTSCERADMTITNDFSYFSFDELLQEPAMFITIPLLKENKFIGTLAYQLNQEKIYAVTNQYIGLGKTGEVTLVKREDSYVVFVSPTRNNADLAFKKISLHTEDESLSQANLITKQGTGTAVDYRGENVITASVFIPKIDWGMTVKIDQNEVLQPMNTTYQFLLIFLSIFLLLLLITLYISRKYLIQKYKEGKFHQLLLTIPATLRNPFLILLLLFLGLTIKNIVQGEMHQLSIIHNAKDQAIQNIQENANTIEAILAKIAFVGQSIAEDLQTNHLIKDDIPTRLKRDIKENSTIVGITILFSPYTYDKKIQLYAPSITRVDDTFEEKVLNQSSGNDEEETSIFKAAWYTQALEKGSVWLLNAPSETDHNKTATATYSCAFFDKDNKPNGVILITYSLADIIHIAEYSRFGQTGYSIILSDNGTFVFHPIHQIVQTQTTFFQFAQSKGNEELAAIAQKALSGKPTLDSYLSETTNDTFAIYTQPIAINKWVIGAIFSETEVSLPAQTVRHYYFWILIWLTLFLIALCGLLCSYGIIPVMEGIVLANIILMLALISSWYVIKITTTINREAKTVITDQASLDKFLNDLDEESQRKHEASPLIIPFGIYLYSIDIPDTDHIIISGYIWDKYDVARDKDVSRSISLPQATRMTLGTPLVSTANGWETVTMNIQGTLFQDQDYSTYPFDQQQVKIIFEHRDIEKNILLTPDLASYKKISPEATPGLDKEFSLSGFDVQQTFFEYHKIDPTTNFGFTDYGKVTDHFQLIYNVIMNRNLLNPFVLFLLPLLVILFTLFCTLLMTEKKTDPFSVLAPYTGLFFALVILHRALREQHPTGSTLYMEYAFFYTYITIILLIIHTILTHYYTHWTYYQERALRVIKLLFWPFQFVTWLVTTLIIFY